MLENWLKEKGYYKKARILPEEIAYVVAEKIESRDQWEEKRKTGYMINVNAVDKKVKRLEIRDKKQIEICFREYREQWLLDNSFIKNTDNNNRYIIGFYGEDKGNFDYGSIEGNNVPDFLKKYFEN